MSRVHDNSFQLIPSCFLFQVHVCATKDSVTILFYFHQFFSALFGSVLTVLPFHNVVVVLVCTESQTNVCLTRAFFSGLSLYKL